MSSTKCLQIPHFRKQLRFYSRWAVWTFQEILTRLLWFMGDAPTFICFPQACWTLPRCPDFLFLIIQLCTWLLAESRAADYRWISPSQGIDGRKLSVPFAILQPTRISKNLYSQTRFLWTHPCYTIFKEFKGFTERQQAQATSRVLPSFCVGFSRCRQPGEENSTASQA